MHTDEKTPRVNIIHAPSQSISLRSAALVTRGLRDLTRNSNWLIRKVFPGSASHLSISAKGHICALLPNLEGDVQQLCVYDLEQRDDSAPQILPIVNPEFNSSESHAAFAWSPTGRYLVGVADAWKAELQLFDLEENRALDAFGKFSKAPGFLAWSDGGGLFAAASVGSDEGSLCVWNVSHGAIPLCGAPANIMRTPDGCERQTPESEFGEEGVFEGYGKMAFSPDEKSLAVALEYKGDWADDSILITDVPSLQKLNIFQTHGHITDIHWTPDSRQIMFCTGGKAYRLTVDAMAIEELPFSAELCVCHPFLRICVCFSSWLKNSAEGRLCVFDLNRLELLDECPAVGIVALRWSGDGSKAYALTLDGFAHIYESPIL